MHIILAISILAADSEFVRGDVDGDFRIAFRDAIRLLDYQFADGPPPPCLDAGDFDDDGAITLGDAIGLLFYLFAGGSAPPPPGIRCGADPTPDPLTCEVTQARTPRSIVVRGEDIDGTAFFFCLDRSGSMNQTWKGRVKIQHAKEWIIEAIQALDAQMELSLVVHDAGMMIFSEEPVLATDRAKERAIAWVMGIPTGQSTCLAPAGVKTVSIANRSSSAWPRIFIISDGVPLCNGQYTQEQSLRDITAANVRKFPIDTVFVPDDGGDQDPEFMRELARRNGGEPRLIDTGR